MSKISLAKALKVKNRIAGKLASLNEKIKRRNSVLADSERDFDIKQAIETRRTLSQALVAIKTAIYRANLDIQNTLYELAEDKGDIEFWKSIDTSHGPKLTYSEEPVLYEAVIRQTDVDNEVAALERDIDNLQDKVDQYNHEVQIEIRDEYLNL